MVKKNSNGNLFEISMLKEMILLMYQNPEGINKTGFRSKIEVATTTEANNLKLLVDNYIAQINASNPILYCLTERGKIIGEQLTIIMQKMNSFKNLSGFGIIDALNLFKITPNGCIKNDLRNKLKFVANTTDNIIEKFLDGKIIAGSDNSDSNTGLRYKLTQLGMEISEPIQICMNLMGELNEPKEQSDDLPSEPLFLNAAIKGTEIPNTEFFDLVKKIHPDIINIGQKKQENKGTKISTFSCQYENIIYHTVIAECGTWEEFILRVRELKTAHFFQYSKFLRANQIGLFSDETEYDFFQENWIDSYNSRNEHYNYTEHELFQIYKADKGRFPNFKSWDDARQLNCSSPEDLLAYQQSPFDKQLCHLTVNLRDNERFSLFLETRKLGFSIEELSDYYICHALNLSSKAEYKKIKSSGVLEGYYYNGDNPDFTDLKKRLSTYENLKKAGFRSVNDYNESNDLGFQNSAEFLEFKKSGALSIEIYHRMKKIPQQIQEYEKIRENAQTDMKKYEDLQDWSIAFQKLFITLEQNVKISLLQANRYDLIDSNGNESIVRLLEKNSSCTAFDCNQIASVRILRNVIVHEVKKIDQKEYQMRKSEITKIVAKIKSIPLIEWKQFYLTPEISISYRDDDD